MKYAARLLTSTWSPSSSSHTRLNTAVTAGFRKGVRYSGGEDDSRISTNPISAMIYVSAHSAATTLSE